MAALDVIDVKGQKAGSVELPSEIFDVQTNVPLIHQVVVAQLAAARQGTHKTKNRGAVSGSGVKPFKQKGTGRSRQGSVRAPEHRGGGVVHGPVPRKYDQRTPKKMIAAGSSYDALHESESVMAGQKIRIRLKSYDHEVIDTSARKIVDTVTRAGASVVGPVPLPTEKNVVVVIRSPHKYKDSREHFEKRTHKRLIDIIDPTPKAVDSLMRLDLPADVNIEIKL